MANQTSRFGLYLALGIGAIVIIGMLVQIGNRQLPDDFAQEGRPFLGAEDAPLTAYIFEDYKCPVCQRYEMQGAAQHNLDTWLDTGKVRLVVKTVAFIGDDSWNAADAALCVWKEAPAEWADWNHYVFSHQEDERATWATASHMRDLADQWGKVDMDAYDACIADGSARDLVQENTDEWYQAGIGGTPMIFVDGQIINALDTDAVDTAFQAALADL